jgi:hypothetical protein
MSDDPSYILDIQGLGEEPDLPPCSQGAAADDRKWIGVQFDCCGVYSRIYRNAEGSAYVGHCPRCQRRVQVRIGPGGTSSRMFRAT